MRRLSFLVLAAVIALALGAVTAHAQDIVGVSFRPTDAMPPGTSAGTADIITNDDGTYTVSADFSRVSDALVLDDFDDASAFVVWAVDMSAAEHNIGALNEDLVLEGESVDYLVAQLLLSAESSADANSREGEVLFRTEIRKPDASAATAATATPAAAASASPTAAAADKDAEPKVLPTTGQLLRDLMVLAAVGVVLVLGGLQLRRARVSQ
jgi:hypothetical protein